MRSEAQNDSRVATKPRAIRIVTGKVVDKSLLAADRDPKNGGRPLTPSQAKAAKVYRNPRTHHVARPGKDVGTSVKRTMKFRRASATSDEVFTALAKAFSPL